MNWEHPEVGMNLYKLLSKVLISRLIQINRPRPRLGLLKVDQVNLCLDLTDVNSCWPIMILNLAD